MESADKLRRALADEWEFVGDPNSLCQLLRAEVLRLRQALQQVALLGDNMSDVHHRQFDTGPGQPIANGWRVAEKMRELANDVVGNEAVGEDLTIYKRAFDSMAAQMIHPKMTGLEMAKMQLE